MKASIATTLNYSRGHLAKALPENPYDGHSLGSIILDVEHDATVNRLSRRGIQGSQCSTSIQIHDYISGHTSVTDPIKRDLRRLLSVLTDVGCAREPKRCGKDCPFSCIG